MESVSITNTQRDALTYALDEQVRRVGEGYSPKQAVSMALSQRATLGTLRALAKKGLITSEDGGNVTTAGMKAIGRTPGEQFDRLRAAKADVRREREKREAEQQARRERWAVLSHAFDGIVTTEWAYVVGNHEADMGEEIRASFVERQGPNGVQVSEDQLIAVAERILALRGEEVPS